ncbi:hypothetical protein MCOR25_000686 [Pyricularia grisea]|uniref:Uncharacterized protein n=1 Tax=Pyricularia grisea TaxID=148305 RepID=A0A6P8BBH0_PYRGI|nr:uncharacterized protein PgNI_04026 [Pyricularia grisea]KAI6382388.1 hypothetical protein MCOR25_000686 [Pyricularia grisea]TLD13175.1 hypothetical protein PgNI_04026 [Pyricularia grisea]
MEFHGYLAGAGIASKSTSNTDCGLGLLGDSAQPEPLQIVKRRESVLRGPATVGRCGGRGGDGGGGSPRRTSGDTDTSGGGSDAPLTIPKRRCGASGSGSVVRKSQISSSWTWSPCVRGGGHSGIGPDAYDDSDEDSAVSHARPSLQGRNVPDVVLTQNKTGSSFISRSPSGESFQATQQRFHSPPSYNLYAHDGGDPYSRANTCLPFLSHAPFGRQQYHQRPPLADPSVLVPCVTVVPECKGVDAGRRSFWAAVQVSTQLTRPEIMVARNRFGDVWNGLGEQSQLMPRVVHDDELGFHQFGYLYDINLEVFAVDGSSLMEVLMDRTAPTTLAPGDKILALAHVELHPAQRPDFTDFPGQEHGRRHDSEELIRDLELQLGSTRAEFLRVRLTYRHSGFPQQQPQQQRQDVRGGDSLMSSTTTTTANTHKIETQVVAAIERRSSTSPWSPSPASMPNPLIQIVASCWGVAAARDVMDRTSVGRQSQASGRSCRSPAESSVGRRPLSSIQANVVPTVPVRRASLRKARTDSMADSGSERERGTPDPAHSIWSQMRRASSTKEAPGPKPFSTPTASLRGRAPKNPNGIVASRLEGLQQRQKESKNSQGSTTEPPNPWRKRDPDARRESLRETALRNRRSLGVDTLRSLVPSECSSNNGSQKPLVPSSHQYDPRSLRGNNSKGKREAGGRWGWGGWW